jgi:hypothetical protein
VIDPNGGWWQSKLNSRLSRPTCRVWGVKFNYIVLIVLVGTGIVDA